MTADKCCQSEPRPFTSEFTEVSEQREPHGGFQSPIRGREGLAWSPVSPSQPPQSHLQRHESFQPAEGAGLARWELSR